MGSGKCGAIGVVQPFPPHFPHLFSAHNATPPHFTPPSAPVPPSPSRFPRFPGLQLWVRECGGRALAGLIPVPRPPRSAAPVSQGHRASPEDITNHFSPPSEVEGAQLGKYSTYLLPEAARDVRLEVAWGLNLNACLTAVPEEETEVSSKGGVAPDPREAELELHLCAVCVDAEQAVHSLGDFVYFARPTNGAVRLSGSEPPIVDVNLSSIQSEVMEVCTCGRGRVDLHFLLPLVHAHAPRAHAHEDANPAAPAARNLGDHHGTGEILPFCPCGSLGRHMHLGLLGLCHASRCLPSDFLHPKLRKMDAVLITLKLMTRPLRRLRRAVSTPYAYAHAHAPHANAHTHAQVHAHAQ